MTLIVDMILLGGGTLYRFYEARTKRRHAKSIYGPTILVAMGSLLILADPVRHVLQDTHHLHTSMYISNCPVRALQLPPRPCTVNQDCGSHDCGDGYYSVHPGEDCFTCFDDGDNMCSEGAETFSCLTMVGWIVTVACTYVGLTLFLVGVLWNSSAVFGRIVRQWKELRR